MLFRAIVVMSIVAAAATPASAQQWTAGTPLLSPRHSAAAAIAGTRIYIAGGRDAGGNALNLVESAPVDLATGAMGSWRSESALAVVDVRSTMVALGNFLYYSGQFTQLQAGGTLAPWQTAPLAGPLLFAIGTELFSTGGSGAATTPI